MNLHYVPKHGDPDFLHTAGMSIAWPTAQFLEEVCDRHKPKIAVDIGTGNGVSLCAMALHMPHGTIWTVDNTALFMDRARARLRRITHHAKIHFIHSPLVKGNPDKRTWWYDPKALDQIKGPIDLLFVDGPEGLYDRSKALPVLLDKLAPRARVYLDDCGRPRERGIFETWKNLLTAKGRRFLWQYVSPGRGVGEITLQR